MFENSNAWESLNKEITGCQLCPRLVAWREQVARTRRRSFQDQTYWGKPVPGFGDVQARILVVGLAPGAHGSNRTGRMFSGDGSGDFLYPALYESGFASQPVSQSIHDGMKLTDIFISAVCRCAPPGNKPTRIEIANCRPYLEAEIGLLAGLKGIVALGKIAFDEVVHIYRWKGHQMPSIKFAHGVFIETTEGLPWLLASYHPSRQNTQTGRLTKNMFADIWERAKTEIIDPASP